jgi:Zn-dependent M16 (insulinase) family peptidase
MKRALVALAVAVCSGCPGHAHRPTTKPATAPVALADLREREATHGFTPVTVYLDDTGRRMGARLVHDATGFTFDYLQIESAPQGYLWVNSFPTSDKGEPHTQEHLLLGKGNRGRTLGSAEAMQLAESSAFTKQWRTAYHFHTVAGHEVFWPVFRGELDALLNPDYSDEEIRREVRNFGVDAGDDGALHLEEKGTVYNEMVRTYEDSDTIVWDAAGRLLFGPTHPLALSSGGTPAALRELTATDIRTFHDASYHLANMGMIAAFPAAMALGDVLDHTDAILDELAGRKGKVTTEADLPAPASAAAGTVEIVDYPFSTTTNPGPVMLAWPPTRDLADADRILLSLFLDAFAGDESTTLYKAFIDSKTRTLDVGADGVAAYLSPDVGLPIYLTLSSVKPEHLTEADVVAIRAAVLAALQRIADLPEGDPELVAFDARVGSRVTDLRRRLTKLLNSPPRFGYRGTGSEWEDFLHLLEKSPGFEKSLTMRPALAEVQQVLAAGGNPWTQRLRDWGLLDVPYGIAARPSPERMATLEREHQARIDAEVARLTKQYDAPDAATALARYQADYDAETKKIEDAGKNLAMPPFVDSPPMTLDDDLEYTTTPIAGIPALTASFDSMTSARVGLAFRVDAVAEDDLFYLALLPGLMSDAGIHEDGVTIPADEMTERLRREILDLDVGYTSNLRTGRLELVVEGAGNDLDESRAALEWMARVMFAPDWRADNLPRLRDLVDQALTRTRQAMQGAEETWVEGPRDVYWRQAWLPLLHTESVLTQAHDLFRLRWMLADGGSGGVAEETRQLLDRIAKASKDGRAKLAARAAKGFTELKASPEARKILVEVGKDLAAMLPDIPDASLAADWVALIGEIKAGLAAGPAAALDGLARARAAILAAGNARAYLIGSSRTEEALLPGVGSLIGRLGTKAPVRQQYTERAFIDERLAQHSRGAPVFVGLVDPNTQSGVFLNLAPGTSYLDTDEDALLDFLTANLYAGHGAHSMFMKTWAAGLAYSNGLHRMPSIGRIEYYAERCPALPQTLRFVIGELEKAEVDPNIAAYAISGAYASRVADSYEDRARAMAEDLVDGVTPEVVRAFRTKLAALRTRDDLAPTLFGRMKAVYGKVLPGYAGKAADVEDGVFFVIGPDAQLDAYQEYLKTAEGSDAILHRLYPRDYWVQ